WAVRGLDRNHRSAARDARPRRRYEIVEPDPEHAGDERRQQSRSDDLEHLSRNSPPVNAVELQRWSEQLFPESTSAVRAGSTSTGEGSSTPRACRRSAGSSVTRRSSTRSKSTPASTDCRSPRPSRVGETR